VKFDGKAAHVTWRIDTAGAPSNRAESGEDGYLLADPLKEIGLGDIGKRVGELEIAVGSRSPSMDDTFRDAFVIEMENLFAKNKIFEQRRAASAGFQRILVVRYPYALVGSQVSFIAAWRMFAAAMMNLLMRFAATALLSFDLFHGSALY
jgi:hypothetical protein